MPEIGARRFHHARLSRVLARPGRHARAPTDSTGAGRPNTGERERTTRKDDGRVVMVVATAFSSDATPGKMGYIFLSRSARHLAVPPAFRARARCDRFETPWVGSLGSSPARWRTPRSGRRTSRRTWWRPRRSARKCACGEICDTPADRPAGWRSRPDASFRLPLSRDTSRAAGPVADPPASASSRRRSQEEKLEPAHEDARVLGQGQDAEHCAYARMPSLGRLHEPRGVLPPSPARAATFPARSRHLPNAHPAHSRPPRAARLARARPTASSPRDACPPEALPRRSLTPADRPKSQKPQYKFSQEPMLTNAPGRAQNW